MKVLITGSDGFIGKNFVAHLSEQKDIDILKFTRDTDPLYLRELVSQADIIFHLAGANRPQNPLEFKSTNTELTKYLCDIISLEKRAIPIVYTSSTQALLDNPYGISKRMAEDHIISLSKKINSPVHLLRLPNVFGKWSRPNYNSVVATFCHNIANNLPIKINNPNTVIELIYIDDLIKIFSDIMYGRCPEHPFAKIQPQYEISVDALANQIYSFMDSRTSLITDTVGSGLTRALYSTYLSYVPPENFSYLIPRHQDSRGSFVEILKTKDSGQFSFFTAHPGITRGGHYHHSKSEKFLVVKGNARFRFRHILTKEHHEIFSCSETPRRLDTRHYQYRNRGNDCDAMGQ